MAEPFEAFIATERLALGLVAATGDAVGAAGRGAARRRRRHGHGTLTQVAH